MPQSGGGPHPFLDKLKKFVKVIAINILIRGVTKILNISIVH